MPKGQVRPYLTEHIDQLVLERLAVETGPAAPWEARYLFVWLSSQTAKSTPPQHRQLIVYYY